MVSNQTAQKYEFTTNSQRRTDMKNQKWIGLAHVRPWEGNTLLGNGIGAFVPVVGLANSSDELATLAATLLYHHEFEVIEVDDIELLSHRLQRHQVESDLLSIADELSEDNRVQLGAFQVYQP